MIVDFNQKLKNLDGTDMVEQLNKGEEKQEITLKKVCANALVMLGVGEVLEGLKKLELYQLANKIYSSETGQVDLTVSEIAEIEARVNKFYGPMVVGQVYKMLEDN